MTNRTRHAGFTIIELLVTLSILGLMLFLVNQLFNDTSRAVQTSVQTSKTIAASRSINEQFTQDAQAMVGPSANQADSPGYIVLIQQRLPNPTMLNPRNRTEVMPDEIRTDQLVFIRDAEGLKSMTPSGPNSYSTNFIGQPGDRAKVWYGHALRTERDGQLKTGAQPLLGGADAGLDRLANNFVLGRQAMLFNPTNAVTGTRLGNDFANFTFANNASHFSPVQNVVGFTGPALAYVGLTDVTFQNYGPATVNGTLLDVLTDGVADVNDYINTSYHIPANRLRVNTSPDPVATEYASWAIAQGHPVFAQSCSEIIIDFAADLNGNGRVDREFGGGPDNAGAIHWYDTLSRNPANATTAFAWQRLGNGIQPLVSNTANQNIFVFRIDDATPHPGPVGTAADNSSWPYLIRIRYRLHDTRGRLEGNYAAALTDGLNNDGDDETDEPGEDRIAGRWFERIISVPRP